MKRRKYDRSKLRPRVLIVGEYLLNFHPGANHDIEDYLEKNGFEIVESSACVSAENYDEELGAEICLGKIRDKVWMLLGFLLQTAVNGVN